MGFWFWLVFLVSSCGTSTPASRNFSGTQPSNQRQQANDPVSSTAESLSGFFHDNPKGEEAWKHFIENGKHRVARASDFKFSDAAKRDIANGLGPEWEKRIGSPYTGGDINHDRFYKDVAFIVMDTTKSDPGRLGLVIFNDQGNNDNHKVFWLDRERDLSTTILEWASDGLHLTVYREDGSYDVCYINWNSQHETYTCDKPR
jgi:hypothetical protein